MRKNLSQFIHNMTGLDTFNFNMTLLSGPDNNILHHPSQILAVPLIILSLLENVTSLAAVSRHSGKLTSNLRLILSLCVSDLLICVAILGYLVVEWRIVSVVYFYCPYVVLRAVLMTAKCSSLFNLICLALDHYCAIVQSLHYPTLMTKARTRKMIISLWLLSFLFGFSDFYTNIISSPARGQSSNLTTIVANFNDSFSSSSSSSSSVAHQENRPQRLQSQFHYFCFKVYRSLYDPEFLIFGLTIVFAIIISFLYACIYRKIRNFQAVDNKRRNYTRGKRRGLVTTTLIIGTFLLCWLPYCLFNMIIMLLMMTNTETAVRYLAVLNRVDYYMYDLLLLNTLCDPLIYATRMREVQNGYRKIFKLFFKNSRCPTFGQNNRALNRKLSLSAPSNATMCHFSSFKSNVSSRTENIKHTMQIHADNNKLSISLLDINREHRDL